MTYSLPFGLKQNHCPWCYKGLICLRCDCDLPENTLTQESQS